MATTHLSFNDQTNHGRLLRRSLQQLEEGRENLEDAVAAMQTMIDGDGSSDAHFDLVTSKFGFPSNAVAKAAWDELNSLKFKLTTNDSVTDVLAAQIQAFNKFR